MANSCDLSRRGFLRTIGASAVVTGLSPQRMHAAAAPAEISIPQRCCVVMFDGFGIDYYEKSSMPTLKRWERDGFYKPIRGVMPAVTNTNLSGISCGVHADEHGITGNSYWDADADQEQFMSDGNLLTAATIFQRAGRFGIRSILVSAKQKTISLMKQGTHLAIGSQDPPPEIVARYGPAPEIYSPDVNYWVWKVAVDQIRTQSKIGLFFVHTTDYPMHKFAPESVESQVHLKTIDRFLEEAADADPDMAFFIAPDHGLNAKSTVVNLKLVLEQKGVEIKMAMSAERDQYPKHHGGFGGTAFIYLKQPNDADRVFRALRDVEEIEEILTREEAAQKYRLNPHRIGDLWITAARDIVFGHSKEKREKLASDYRSHGSSHELDIPGFIYRYASVLPSADAITTNVDLCKFLYQIHPQA